MSDPAASTETFRAQGCVMVPKLVPESRVAALRGHLAARGTAGTLRVTGDKHVPNTPSVYGDAEVDGLMQDLKPQIEAHTGLRLHPTYSYARIYKKGDQLTPHRDRAACQISISLNLGQEPEDPWALYVGEANAPFRALLTPGDVLIYRGMEMTHWRAPYTGDRLFQAFMHYVDADGPHAGEKFDGRASLGNAFKPEYTGRLSTLLVPGLKR